MKRRNEQSLAEAIGGLIEGAGMRERLDEAAFTAAWSEVVGAMIARHTTGLRFRKGMLTLHVDSAPLRQEMVYMRGEIQARLNERAGHEAVREVVVR